MVASPANRVTTDARRRSPTTVMKAGPATPHTTMAQRAPVHKQTSTMSLPVVPIVHVRPATTTAAQATTTPAPTPFPHYTLPPIDANTNIRSNPAPMPGHASPWSIGIVVAVIVLTVA